ncbi:MAG TPA: hypothetical protein VH138_02855 [Vicinamibacterales bacterium]|nr:hypothetical protein [Vicinamibacterales bacterium]
MSPLRHYNPQIIKAEAGGRRSEVGTVLMVLAFCAVPRIAALWLFQAPADTQYSALARSLVHAHRYVLDGAATARIEPLCPAVFAFGQVLFGSMLAIPVVLSSLAGVALFALTRGATNSARAAWTAVLLYACSPYLVRQAASPMEVTLATSLLIVAAWRMRDVGTAARAASVGLLFGAIVLTRFSFLPISAGGLVLIWRRAAGLKAAIATVVVIVCLAPWMAYSRATDGAIWPSRVGENLYVSTSDWARGVVPTTNVDVLVPLTADLVRDEADQDRALIRRAISYARRHPMEVVALKLRNLGYIMQPRLLPFTERTGSASIVDGRLVVPKQRPRPFVYEAIAAVFQTVLLAGAAGGLWKRRRQLEHDAFLLIVLGGIVAVSVLFYPTSRLLAPASFVLMFYTARNVAR